LPIDFPEKTGTVFWGMTVLAFHLRAEELQTASDDGILKFRRIQILTMHFSGPSCKESAHRMAIKRPYDSHPERGECIIRNRNRNLVHIILEMLIIAEPESQSNWEMLCIESEHGARPQSRLKSRALCLGNADQEDQNLSWDENIQHARSNLCLTSGRSWDGRKILCAELQRH
jgi:hypothetical protein